MNTQPTILQCLNVVKEGSYDISLSPYVGESEEWRSKYSYFTLFKWGTKFGELRRVGSIKRVPFDNTHLGAINALKTLLTFVPESNADDASIMGSFIASITPLDLGFDEKP